MNEKLEGLIEMPVGKKAAGLGAMVALIAGVYWLMFYSSANTELADLEKEISGSNGLRFQVAEQRGIADNLDQFLAEVDTLELELKKALLELPDDREIHTLLAKVSSVGRDAGLEIRIFKEQEEQKKDFYAEVPVEMEVYGTYHQVATFFDEVGHLERIVNLGDIHMQEPKVDSDSVFLRTSVVATTFRFLSEDERPKPEEKAEGKRRGRPQRRAPGQPA
ncbi:MAG: type 4a pilus biogenesis protein PilO [Bdellovibrionales bacterium]|nr:type 4a pilus biogenesis protein PilO [Bdellovibrionales bacterium]